MWAEATKAGAAPPPRRNDLPADLFDFTGREAESAQVEELLRTAGAVAIDGMAGVGKTSLAVHVAHRLAAAYPDGGLYLDLHGFTPGQEPLEPLAALGRLLAALEITHPPAGAVERAALWRSELSRRRALVVLDNAVDAEQVRPLLPGAGKSAVLVTSRNRLVSLDGVPPVSVAPFTAGDAADLFGRAAGLGATDDQAVGQVLQQCGGLPWRCGWPAPACAIGPAGPWRSSRSGCATPPAASTRCSACPCTSSTRRSAACSGCSASCPAPTSTRRWRARWRTCPPTGSARSSTSWSTPTCCRSCRPGGSGCMT
ncbi:hypothetical protein [Dactylosporangium cerinum]